MNRIKIAFFDIDGTLLNFGESRDDFQYPKSVAVIEAKRY